jgi:putative aminopeptidase FrvX
MAIETPSPARELSIDRERLLNFLVGLLEIPSPTGDTERAVAYTRAALAELPLDGLQLTNKGALIATWEGRAADRPRGLTAHLDTLGAMVKEIKPNGRLRLTQIGAYAWQTVEGEGCTIFAADGRRYRGTVQCVQASLHIHGPSLREFARKDETMEVRIDERVDTADETRSLGIAVGDFVAFDPRVELTAAGFLRSRHLDDKAGVACVVAALGALAAAGERPAQRTTVLISNFEETGHGAAAGWPRDLRELLVIDMAAVGSGQNSDEFSASLCLKDSGGPYSTGLSGRLRALALAAGVALRTDIYPFYGSDGGAAWRAGADLEVALAGPGVEASHAYERTHTEALLATSRLIAEWLRHE